MSVLKRLTAACGLLLVASGLVVAPFLTAPAGAAELLQDGGFEAGTGNPLNSPNWTEADSARGTSSNPAGSPLCSTSICSNVNGTSVPRTGVAWARFGGQTSASHTASISQSVVIPAGTAVLTYWYRNSVVTSPFTATVLVKVDGTTVKTHAEATTAQSSYTQQSIDLSAYANGASHTILFSYANHDTGDYRTIIDDVSLTHTPPVPTGTPTVTSTVPSSPSSSTTPLVKGTADAGSTVTLYSNSSCTSAALGTGSATTFAGAGIMATVPANATTTIFAKATKSGQTASGCSSTSVSYTNDSAAPALVTLSSTAPSSPNPSNKPVVKGNAEAGSTVKVYSTSGCTGSPVASGTAAAFASPGLAATVVVGTTTTFRATATDAAGNTSACSTSSLTYTSDLLDGGFEAATGNPALSPFWVEADSLAAGGSPLCRPTVCDTGGGITAPRTGNAWAWFGGFSNAGHTGSLAQTLTIPVGTLSLTYWYKNGTVSAPFDAQLLVKVDGTTVKTQVEAPVADTAYSLQIADLSAYADGASHTISFNYTNGAEGLNNMVVDDVHLSALPATVTGTPTITGTVPGSPSTSTTPLVKGTAESGSTVTLFSDSACTSAPLGSGSAADFAGAGIAATVPAAATTTIFAKASKPAQRDSACSARSVSYTQAAARTAPETKLTKTPKRKVRTLKKKARVSFAFSSPSAGATFECSVDGGAYRPCTSGQKFKLKVGKHRFAVRAVVSGLADASPATYTFKLKRRH